MTRTRKSSQPAGLVEVVKDAVQQKMAGVAKADDFKARASRFEQRYKALCDAEQCQIVVTPILVPTNHGTFELAQRVTVGELPKQPEVD